MKRRLIKVFIRAELFSRSGVLLTLVFFLITGSPLAQEGYAGNPVRPLEKIDPSSIRMVDNTTYCQAGTGVAGYRLEVGEEDQERSSLWGDFSKTPYMEAGCTSDGWLIKYSFIEINDRSKKDFQNKGETFNRVDARVQSFQAGYETGLMKHRLMLQTAIGWQFSEVVYAYEENTTVQIDETHRFSGSILSVGAKFFLLANVFINWEWQQQTSGKSPVKSMNLLGVHLSIRL